MLLSIHMPPTTQIASAGPCLIWRHGLSEGGNGKTQWEDNTDLTHRVAYKFT